MIAPNRPVAQAAAACHARGQKVYAVSDMYLPKEQIEAMLQKCGLDFWMESLSPVSMGCKSAAVSCSSFLQQTALRPAEVLFVGIAPARILPGQRWRVSVAFAAAANPAAIHQNPGGCRRWCRNCHLAKLLPESKFQCCAGGRAAWPAGGWLCHLAAWAARGYTGAKLVFLARDMYLVRQVYQLLYPEEETFYLKASRQSLLPALLQCPMNEQALALLADTLPRQQLTQRQIAAYLGFDSPKEHTTKTYDLRTRPLPCRTKEMLLALAARSKLPEGEPLRRRAEQARVYLEQAGLTDSPVLLVDIGSGGNHPACAGRAAAHPAARLLPCLRCAPAPEPAAGARQNILFDGCPAPVVLGGPAYAGSSALRAMRLHGGIPRTGRADGAGNRAGGCR